MSLFDELKRRNVLRVGAAYLALGWVVVQITSTLAPAMRLPDWTVNFVFWVGLIGLPFVLLFSWVYELTPEGLKRESEIDRSRSITPLTARRLDYAIIALLVAAMLMFAADRFIPRSTDSLAQGGHAPDAASSVGAGHARADADASRGHGPLPQENASTPNPDEKSIAVLPFVNMSSDKEQDYFSDGISEELLNLLAKIPQLKVIARTSSFAFKGREADIEEIARKLRVTHVLEGSVRKSGNTVRITAQLIRTADSTHLWSEAYDRPLDDVFAVQDEIAGAVVTQLKITLLGAAPESRAVDPRAYALYLQGRQLALQGNNFRHSNELYQQAAALDDTYVAPWVGLAGNYTNWPSDELTPAERFQRARELLARALALEPDHAPALAALALIEILDSRDLAAAARLLSRSMALEPGNVDTLANAAILMRRLGRMDRAVALGEYLVVRDPLNTGAHYDLGNAYRYAGRLDEAIGAYRVSLSLAPSTIGIHDKIAGVLLQKGEAQAALAETGQEPGEKFKLGILSRVYDALEQSAEAEAALMELRAQYAQSKAFDIAGIYASRGNADAAFEWLEKAVPSRSADIGALPVYPVFAPLHADARWLPLLRRLGMAPEQLAAIAFEVALPE